jgi:hypothetical protein
MPQSSLSRIPDGPTGTANSKYRLKVPGWYLTGGTAPKSNYGVAVPINQDPPVVSASSLSVAAGGVATVTNGIWDNAPTSYTYQWTRGASNIGGATNNSYAFTAADEGAMIACVEIAINAAGNAQATSNSI